MTVSETPFITGYIAFSLDAFQSGLPSVWSTDQLDSWSASSLVNQEHHSQTPAGPAVVSRLHGPSTSRAPVQPTGRRTPPKGGRQPAPPAPVSSSRTNTSSASPNPTVTPSRSTPPVSTTVPKYGCHLNPNTAPTESPRRVRRLNACRTYATPSAFKLR